MMKKIERSELDNFMDDVVRELKEKYGFTDIQILMSAAGPTPAEIVGARFGAGNMFARYGMARAFAMGIEKEMTDTTPEFPIN